MDTVDHEKLLFPTGCSSIQFIPSFVEEYNLPLEPKVLTISLVPSGQIEAVYQAVKIFPIGWFSYQLLPPFVEI
jgi:hypothetical protein